jgi:uncharacterized protein
VIVVLDSNVWISALEFGGTADRALVRALNDDTVAISQYIQDEIVRVLTTKFEHERPEIEAQLKELLVQALWVELTGEVSGVCRDPADDPILETAWKAQAAYLVAGDKDLLTLSKFRTVSIISLAAYLELP